MQPSPRGRRTHGRPVSPSPGRWAGGSPASGRAAPPNRPRGSSAGEERPFNRQRPRAGGPGELTAARPALPAPPRVPPSVCAAPAGSGRTPRLRCGLRSVRGGSRTGAGGRGWTLGARHGRGPRRDGGDGQQGGDGGEVRQQHAEETHQGSGEGERAERGPAACLRPAGVGLSPPGARCRGLGVCAPGFPALGAPSGVRGVCPPTPDPEATERGRCTPSRALDTSLRPDRPSL